MEPLDRAADARLLGCLAAGLGAVGERLPYGVAIVDLERRVLWSNGAARALLAAGRGLELTASGRLGIARPSEDRRLQRLVVAAAASPAGAGRTLVLTLLRQPDADPLQLLVLGWAPADGAPAATGATVLMFDPGSPRDVSTQLLTEVHGLTGAQARLAALLLRGRTIAEAARELRIAPGTARCHLRRLFAATRTRRQPDLVRFLLQGVAALRTGEIPPNARSGQP